MYIQRRHWLEYDPVALAVLVIGIGIIELLALIICPLPGRRSAYERAGPARATVGTDTINTCWWLPTSTGWLVFVRLAHRPPVRQAGLRPLRLRPHHHHCRWDLAVGSRCPRR